MDGDGEAAGGGDVEGVCGGDGAGEVCAVEDDVAGAGGDLHELWGGGAEVVGAGEDEAEGFLRTIGEADGVGDDAAIEINVRDGGDGGVGEVCHGAGWVGRV